MSKEFNPNAYAQLLASTLPGVIASREEYDRVETIFNDLMDKGEDSLSPEEFKLYELLADLMEAYEKRTLEPIPDASPVERLKYLMEQNGLKQTDLAGIFGGQSVVSAVLNGKREINKDQAKRLGERFSVTPAAFI